MGNGWQSDEFGEHHEGRAIAVLADGTEPKPAVFDVGHAGHVTSEWWVYDGKLRQPLATGLRAGCTCDWRGDIVHPLDWAEVGDHAYDAETPGPRADWRGHIQQIEARAVPVPEDITELLERLEIRLDKLALDAPAAALRVVAALERAAEQVGENAAIGIQADVRGEELTWETVGTALGLPGRAARDTVERYLY
jgi:plasmid stabilization system protein ParE